MPAKKPKELKVLQGTARPDRERQIPKCKPLLGEPPKDLPAEAKRYWKTYAPILEGMGLAGEADKDAFERLANLHAILKRLEKEMLSADLAVDGGREGMKKNPIITAYFQALKEYRALVSIFGLAPGPRQRMETKTEEQEIDEFEELFGSE